MLTYSYNDCMLVRKLESRDSEEKNGETGLLPELRN